MKEAFEKIRKKLDEESVIRANSEKFYSEPQNGEHVDCVVLLKDALSIVSEVEAEYGNGCEKQTYEIRLNGCDDDTTFKMDLTESEYQFLLRVSELANKTSTYGCMPRLYVREHTTTTD